MADSGCASGERRAHRGCVDCAHGPRDGYFPYQFRWLESTSVGAAHGRSGARRTEPLAGARSARTGGKGRVSS